MKSKESFHLMAVPRGFTQSVPKAGGRFIKLKSRLQSNPKRLQLIQWKNAPNAELHILEVSQHRAYSVMGEAHEEEMSICGAVFELSRGGYLLSEGALAQVNCRECLKKYKLNKDPGIK